MAIGTAGAAPRSLLAPLVALAALAGAIGAVTVEARSPDKGFVAFVGRRVVTVTEGSAVEAAGIRPGDRVLEVDGRPVRSVLDYAADVLGRDVGDVVTITFATREGRRDVAIPLVATPTPWIGIVAVALAALMLALGLVALRSERSSSGAAQRFFRTTVVFALVYGGALYWNHLVPVPWLAIGPVLAVAVAPAIVLDFLLGFPARVGGVGIRRVVWVLGLGNMVGAGASLLLARGADGPAVEAHVARAVAFVGAQLVLALACFVIGVVGQTRALGRSRGDERAQRKWLLLGFAACLAPIVAAIPLAVSDFAAFLLGGHRPFLTALMVLWFAAAALAVLRVRLADVDAVIHRSATYASALGAAAGVYFAIALGVGLAFERFVSGAPWASHLFAAALAALLFGPIHRQVGGLIERRFFRDRVHYLSALRELDHALLEVRAIDELCRAVVERSVAAVRARGGALYLGDGETLRLAHAVGVSQESLTLAEALEPSEDGVAILVEDERREGVLRLDARLAGDLYSSEDRALLETLAGRVATALASSRAYTTIREQNEEIRGLRDKLEDENRYLKGRLDAAASELVGSSRAIATLKKQIEKLAPGQATVLIRGESGTGKTLVARALHEGSERAEGPFVHVDCASFAKGVIESELFGHERGAFTGADRLRRGCFELADGGTLFLDEIGELPLDLQPKLLRLLQERTFTRLGGSAPVEVDLRIVTATHRDLESMIERGELRRDLFYRLAVVTVDVPSLRERRGDVAELVDAMMPALCRRNHRPLRSVSEDAMTALTTYDWPGNVRELSNVLERAVVLAEGETIERDDLALRESPLRREPVPASVPPPPTHREEMERVEREHLVRSLAEHGGNKSATASALGMPRTTLISKLHKHGLA